MTRPFCVTGFTMLFTLFVLGANASEKAVRAVLCAALIAFALSLAFRASRRDRTLPTAFLAVVLSTGLLIAAGQQQTTFAERYADREVEIRGVLAQLPWQQDGRNYYVLQLDTADGEPCDEKLRLVSRAPLDITPADRVTGTVKTFVLGASGEDGVSEYYRSIDITMGGYPVDDLQVEKGVRTDLPGCILQFRLALSDALLTALPNDNGALLAAIAFGAEDTLPDRVNNAFRAVGISHILVVSGLHLTVWTMLLFAVLRTLGVRRRLSAAVGIAFVCFFTVLTGAAPSILRSAVMLCTVYAAEFFRRESDSLNSIGLALTGMLLLNPYAARSLSLLLSVFATLGILLLGKPIERVLMRPFAKVRQGLLFRLCSAGVSAVAVTAAATVFTLPVQLWAIGNMSTVTLLANLLLLTAGNAAMVLGSFGALLTLAGVFGQPVLLLAGWVAQYLITVTERLAQLPGVLLPINSNFAKLLLALAFFACAVFVFLKKPNKRMMRLTAAVLCCAFLVCNTAVYLRSRSALQIAVADVGDGMSVVLSCRGETVVLGCGGDYFADSEICAILSAYGATYIDALILPDETDELFSAALSVGGQLPVKTVYYAQTIKPETLPVGETKTPIDKTVLTFADGALTVAVQSSGAYRYAEILYGSFRALVSFTEENDFYGDSASVLCAAGELPRNTDAADFELTVFSVADPGAADVPALRSQAVCTTAENGSISLLVFQDGAFQYRRM